MEEQATDTVNHCPIQYSTLDRTEWLLTGLTFLVPFPNRFASKVTSQPRLLLFVRSDLSLDNLLETTGTQ